MNYNEAGAIEAYQNGYIMIRASASSSINELEEIISNLVKAQRNSDLRRYGLPDWSLISTPYIPYTKEQMKKISNGREANG